jgi:hypothetical protein
MRISRTVRITATTPKINDPVPANDLAVQQITVR